MQILKKIYYGVSRIFGTSVEIDTPKAVEPVLPEPVVMPVEPASDYTPPTIEPQPDKTSFEQLSGWEKYRFMTEALESMFTQERYSENSFIGICSAFPFSDCEIPPDALTCDVVDIQSDTPVLFRGEVMRVRRSVGRMQECLKARIHATPFAKRFEKVLTELDAQVSQIEAAAKVLDELTKVTDDCASAYRHEDIVVQQKKDPKGYSKLCKGKCRNKECEPTETCPQAEPKKD